MTVLMRPAHAHIASDPRRIDDMKPHIKVKDALLHPLPAARPHTASAEYGLSSNNTAERAAFLSTSILLIRSNL